MAACWAGDAAKEQGRYMIPHDRETLQALLESRGVVFRGNACRCPFHDDKSASAGIYEKSGAWRFKCHACGAGGDIEDVRKLLDGGKLGDQKAKARRDDAPNRTMRSWPTIDGTIAAARAGVAKQCGEAVEAGRWMYRDAAGVDVACAVRFNLPTPPGEKQEKTFRPVHRVAGGWTVGDPPGLWPLYRLPEVLAAVKSGAVRVYICEGEKAADAAWDCGLVATTSAHGAKSAPKSDWTPLAGVGEVCILPDADEAGEGYAVAVAGILAKLPTLPTVKIVRLAAVVEGFSKGGDFFDFQAEYRDGQAAETIRAEIESLADAAKRVESAGLVKGDASHDATGGAPVLTCLADVEARRVNWLWLRRIALGRIALLVGVPGEGKSFLALFIAACVTLGLPFPDGTLCPQGDVILISPEDDPGDTIRPRLDAHRADVRRVHILSGVQWAAENGEKREVFFTLENLAALEEAFKRIRPLLLIIDPIGSVLGGDTDSHRDNEVRGRLAPVAKLAEKYGVAVLIVAHRRKSAGTHADDLALGSRAFTGIARAVWHLSRDPENKDRRLFLPGKNNLAREGSGLAFTIEGDPAHLVWEPGPVMLNADEGLAAENEGGERPGPKPEARSAATDWLRTLLADGERATADIQADAKAAGFAWRTVQRAADALQVTRTKGAFNTGWRWALPNVPSYMPTNPQEKNLGILASSIKQGENDDILRSHSEDAILFSLGGKRGTLGKGNGHGHDPSMRAGGGTMTTPPPTPPRAMDPAV
jgi:hypothetical protein